MKILPFYIHFIQQISVFGSIEHYTKEIDSVISSFLDQMSMPLCWNIDRQKKLRRLNLERWMYSDHFLIAMQINFISKSIISEIKLSILICLSVMYLIYIIINYTTIIKWVSYYWYRFSFPLSSSDFSSVETEKVQLVFT